ncbi:MAG: pimeloyl-ACP methyl ester esterase BioH [Psychromonas sp.]
MSIEQGVYCKVLGQGPDLVLLHGWGVNSVVWNPVIEMLSEHFRVHLIDLPGFGYSEELAEYSIDTMVDKIMPIVPENAIWCGWSLGGLIATHASYLYPEKINKLIQVCTSVKFVSEGEGEWLGVEANVFNNFALSLQKNKDKTLTRFIGLQAMGSLTAKQDNQTFKKLLIDTHKPSLKALDAGLTLLNGCDLREEFKQLSIPCLSLYGKFDGLVPVQTSAAMQLLLADSKQKIFASSSHAPFVSEPNEFSQSIIDFGLEKV